MNLSSTLLEKAWLYRWNQNIETALFYQAQWQHEKEGVEISFEEETTALLLSSSLLRAQGLKQKSSALLAKMNRSFEASGRIKSFYLLFELGIEYWVEQDISSALENFLLAEKQAITLVQKIFSQSNILWCLEALDLERQETEIKLRELIRENPRPEDCKHVLEQWTAYQLRTSFYRDMTIPVHGESGQAQFFTQWVQSLPYVLRDHQPQLPQDYLWQGSYRLRTLAKVFIESDAYPLRLGDAIDRLYLWTWLFMSGDAALTREKLILVVDSLLRDLELDRMAKENLLLLRNALGWIELLYPFLKSKFQKIMSQLHRISSSHYFVLEAEYDLILNFKNREFNTSATDQLFSYFSSFQEIYDPNQRKNCWPVLHEALSSTQACNQASDVVIDLDQRLVQIKSKGKSFYSKVICQLIRWIHEHEQVVVSELSSYDVANGVYRLRKLFGSDVILWKNGALMKGKNWPSDIVIKGGQINESHVVLKSLNIVESDKYLQAAKAIFSGAFTRKDIEERMKISKSTANRMLESWHNAGRITKTGNAKATTYFWSKNEEETTL